MRNSASHWEGNGYSRNSAVQYEIAMAMLAQRRFSGDENVLDVGCGDGKITYQIALRVPRGHVTGVDSSESMLGVAQESHGMRRNLSFALEDVQSLSYENQFGLVFSALCIQWVPDKAAAFRGIRKSLQPRGEAMLLMAFRNQEFLSARRQTAGQPHWRRYFESYSDPSDCLEDRQYEKYAAEAGLIIHSYLVEPRVVEFVNLHELTGFLKALTPNLTRLPDEGRKSEFMREMVDGYLERVPRSKEGNYQYTYTLAKMLAEAPATPR